MISSLKNFVGSLLYILQYARHQHGAGVCKPVLPIIVFTINHKYRRGQGHMDCGVVEVESDIGTNISSADQAPAQAQDCLYCECQHVSPSRAPATPIYSAW